MPTVAPSMFMLDPANVRLHGQRSREAIARSLRDLGAGRSIVVDAEGMAIAGNGVLSQAQEAGMPVQTVETEGDTLIVVRRTDLATDDPRRVALALADNRIGELSAWDEVRLEGARAELDAALLAATALPPDTDIPPTPDGLDGLPAAPAAAGAFRFCFGAYRSDLAETTFRAILSSIPDAENPQSFATELRRRIGL